LIIQLLLDVVDRQIKTNTLYVMYKRKYGGSDGQVGKIKPCMF